MKKENLPSKICPSCNRSFNWRKKWKLNIRYATAISCKYIFTKIGHLKPNSIINIDSCSTIEQPLLIDMFRTNLKCIGKYAL